MLTVETRSDTTILDRLLRTAPARSQAETLEAAKDVVADIRANWSSTSPSAPGKPPAVVTGELDASFDVTVESRGERVRIVIRVKAEHARHLEYGTKNMRARPFLRPAMKRAERTFKRRWKVVVTP